MTGKTLVLIIIGSALIAFWDIFRDAVKEVAIGRGMDPKEAKSFKKAWAFVKGVKESQAPAEAPAAEVMTVEDAAPTESISNGKNSQMEGDVPDESDRDADVSEVPESEDWYY
jgi:hypothetical protein